MKNLNYLLQIGLMLCLGLFFTACEKAEEVLDPCANITCLNGGTCDDGSCDCPEGFSGADCSTEDLCITQSVECLNGGTCEDGSCLCPEGYEGDDCGAQWADKMVGNYDYAIECTNGDAATAIVTATTDGMNMVTFTFEPNIFAPTTFPMTSSTEFTFDDTTIGGWHHMGLGTINEDGIITINSDVPDHNTSCTHTFTPQ